MKTWTNLFYRVSI